MSAKQSRSFVIIPSGCTDTSWTNRGAHIGNSGHLETGSSQGLSIYYVGCTIQYPSPSHIYHNSMVVFQDPPTLNFRFCVSIDLALRHFQHSDPNYITHFGNPTFLCKTTNVFI